MLNFAAQTSFGGAWPGTVNWMNRQRKESKRTEWHRGMSMEEADAD